MPRSLFNLPLIAAAALACGAAPAAAATTVHCGEEISQDTRVANDLLNCPRTALTVTADDVTLDLGGHLVDGTNAPGSEGIAVDGHSDVRIVNGTVRDFRFNGVALRNSKRGVVEGLTIRQIGEGGQDGEDVSAGILVDGSDDVRLLHDSVSNAVTAWQSDGIDVLGSERVLVEASEASHDAWNGLVLFQSPGSRVTANRTAGNQNSGISVIDSPSVTVAGNTSSDQVNPDTAGIVLFATTRDTAVGNRLTGNNLGIDLENGTTASNVFGNDVSGFGDGIGVLDSDHNTVTRNNVHDVPGNGIDLDAYFAEQGSHWNLVSGNAVTGAGSDGYFVGDLSTGNRLERNLATRGGANGFLVTTAGSGLGSNTATNNRLRGIEAVVGTLDRGGNRAFGNRRSPQCTGVRCG
jgi:nitrous oxidase accessory protein NosD